MRLRFRHAIAKPLAVLAGSAAALFVFTGTAFALPHADLVGTFVHGAHSLSVGEESKYVFQITNTGPSTAANIDASVHVPKELKYVKHLNGNTCQYDATYGDRVVHCYLTGPGGGGTLGAGQSVNFRVVLKGRETGKAACTNDDWSGIYPGPNKCLWGYAGDSSPSDPNPHNNHDNYRVHVTQ